MDREPGWYSDPTGRCVLRRWAGAAWTAEVVRTGDRPGTTSNDPTAFTGPVADHGAEGAQVADRAGEARRGFAVTAGMPTTDRRVLRILGVLMLGFAVSTTFLFWWEPNVMLVPIGYWFDDRSVLAVWAWVAALDSILLVAALLLLGTSSPGRVGISVTVVAAACLPLAFAVHARLPHNLIPEYQAALSGMERVIPQLQRRGPERIRTRCEWGAWSGNKPAHVTRRYGLTDGTRDDTMAAIAGFFEANGYAPDGQPRRWHRYLHGPDTTIDIVSDAHPTEPRATFEVRLERQSCSVFE